MQQPYTLQLECTRVHDLVVIHCSAGQSFLSIFFLFFSRLFLSDAGACLAANYAGIPNMTRLAIQSGKWDQLGSLALLL